MQHEYEVIAISVTPPYPVRILSSVSYLDYDNADAYMHRAIIRRGVETEFYAVVPAGSYKDGDVWEPERQGAIIAE